MTWRMLRVLVKQLPRNGAVMRALDEAAQWDVTDHLLASVLEQLHRLGGSKYEVPRPGRTTNTEREQDTRDRMRRRYEERERQRTQQLDEQEGTGADDG
jgi:hypothetical protein